MHGDKAIISFLFLVSTVDRRASTRGLDSERRHFLPTQHAQKAQEHRRSIAGACRESRTGISSQLRWWRPTSTHSPNLELSLGPSTTTEPCSLLPRTACLVRNGPFLSQPSSYGQVNYLKFLSQLQKIQLLFHVAIAFLTLSWAYMYRFICTI